MLEGWFYSTRLLVYWEDARKREACTLEVCLYKRRVLVTRRVLVLLLRVCVAFIGSGMVLSCVECVQASIAMWNGTDVQVRESLYRMVGVACGCENYRTKWHA